MKMLVIAAIAASSLVAVPSIAQDRGGNGNGAFSTTPNQCLAAERAVRNTPGGDRQKGGFGPAQDGFTALFEDGFYWDATGITYYDYGQFLQDWKRLCNG
jgi:hypothetical protein